MLTDSNISRILEAAMSKSCDFAEVFYEESTSRGVALLNGKVTSAGTNYDAGVGIRLMAGTNVVYVYSSDKDPEVLINLAKEAADALKGGSKAEIMELQSKCFSTPNLINIDPMKVPKSDMVDFIKKASDYASSYNEMITQTTGSIATSNRIIRVYNTRGLNKEESQSRIRLSMEVIATKDGEKQTGRIAPGTMRGYEFINEYPILDKVAECCDSAIRMAGAGYAPSGKMPVILGNGFGGVIFHEACGHALEATSVGIKSSCFTDKIGERIASPIVNAFDNARIEGEWGSYMVDDEGNDSSNLQLIKDGICVNYLVDELGSRRMNMPATGCARRSNYSYAPTSRMSNTFIDKGTDKVDDIIADTEYGLYCTKLGGGSVDTATGEFNFAANEAFIVRNGKVCEPVRGATLIGKGQEVLMDIDRVADDLELSAGACGSISGSVPVTVGQPTIRVSSMLVGGRDSGEEA